MVSPESSLSSTSPPVSLLSSDGGVKTADGSSDDEDDCYYQGTRESWLTTGKKRGRYQCGLGELITQFTIARSSCQTTSCTNASDHSEYFQYDMSVFVIT